MNQLNSDEITIEFIDEAQEKEILKFKINETIENIFVAYSKMKKKELDSLYFLCNGEQIQDFQKTFYELANEENKRDKHITILVLKLPKSAFIVFLHNSKSYKKEYDIEDNIGTIFSNYLKEKRIVKNKVMFKYKSNLIDQNQTINQFIKSNKYNLSEVNQNQNQTIDIMSESSKNQIVINIEVIDIPFFTYVYKEYKIILISILSIIGGAVVAFAIIFLLKGSSKQKATSINSSSLTPSSNAPSTQNKTIPKDYFIKATYFSQASETVRLISNNYNLNKIKNMSIDGNIMNPTKLYTFNEKGQHII